MNMMKYKKKGTKRKFTNDNYPYDEKRKNKIVYTGKIKKERKRKKEKKRMRKKKKKKKRGYEK